MPIYIKLEIDVLDKILEHAEKNKSKELGWHTFAGPLEPEEILEIMVNQLSFEEWLKILKPWIDEETKAFEAALKRIDSRPKK